MTMAGSFIGIDVGKRQFDIAERASGAQWTTANDGAGIAGLVERLRAAGPVALIVLEATGGYEMPLVAALTVAQLPVVVVNPRQVRDFARAVWEQSGPLEGTPGAAYLARRHCAPTDARAAARSRARRSADS